MQEIFAADLYCGAGGFSLGLMEAAAAMGVQVRIVAVNHWQVAIATHSGNFPDHDHICEGIETISPRKAVPGGRLHLLLGSPECTGHSNARGGKPTNDQTRSSAWHILRWAEELVIDHIILENVREFRDWGPLGEDGKPIEKDKGKFYAMFLKNLRTLGYTVQDRILNAAHYGDPTSRQRLFIQAKKGRNQRIKWPEQTHAEKPESTLFPARPYRTAREIIDWSIQGESIYTRKKPLAPNTMRRILTGLQKFGGLPFLMGAGGPQGSQEPRELDRPIGTILADDHKALVQPFLVVNRNNQYAQSLDSPVPTLTTLKGIVGLAQPYVVPFYSERSGQECRSVSVDKPLHTVTTENRFGLADPYLVAINHAGPQNPDERRVYGMDRAVPTLTTKNGFALVEPYLVKYYEGSDSVSLDRPTPTVTAQFNHLYLAQPFLMKFYKDAHNNASIDEPCPTIKTKDRLALVHPCLVPEGQYGDVIGWLDIRFRMLTPKELARAMSFPESYQFAGTKAEQVRQIGNAVAGETAKALCSVALQSLAA